MRTASDFGLEFRCSSVWSFKRNH